MASLKSQIVDESFHFKASIWSAGAGISFYFGLIALYLSQGWHIGNAYNQCQYGHEIYPSKPGMPPAVSILMALCAIISFLTVLVDLKLTMVLRKKVAPISNDSQIMSTSLRESLRIPIQATIQPGTVLCEFEPNWRRPRFGEPWRSTIA